MNAPSSTTIIGLDLSLTSTGIAISANTYPVRTHRIRSTGKKTDSWDQRAGRLGGLSNDISGPIGDSSLVMIEAPSYGSNTGSQWDRAGLWWSLYHRLIQRDCTVVPIAPTTRAKYATGKGNAGKDEVLAAAIRRYPEIDITGNDVADAVILMAIGCRLAGRPLEEDLPRTHLDAMSKISLPIVEGAAA